MIGESPEERLARWLHETIPLSAAMGLEVRAASPGEVRLFAPLAPNINEHRTVFGGSAAALATLAAWTLLHVRLERAAVPARLVIQRSRIEYERPVPGDFEAVCQFTDEHAWRRFRATLARRGRARLALAAHLLHAQRRVAEFEGDFVALARE